MSALYQTGEIDFLYQQNDQNINVRQKVTAKDKRISQSQASIQKLAQIESNNSSHIYLKCREHTQQHIKYLCLDQNCDHQRMMCLDCENSDHYNRHRNKCILVNELLHKKEKTLEMKNWPQDIYLRCFQDYLKNQTNECEGIIIEMCKNLMKFMEDKMKELIKTMSNICKEQQHSRSDKNCQLMDSYIKQCSDLDQIREIFQSINNQEFLNSDQYHLQQQNENTITQIVNDMLVDHVQFKQFLNQKFGFGYFEEKQVNKSSIDTGLIQQEFDSIKASITQMSTFIEKNSTSNTKINKQNNPSLYSNDSQNYFGNIGQIDAAENENYYSNGIQNSDPYSFCLTTEESEMEKILFLPNEKSATIKKTTKPTFFYTNIIPQHGFIQVRITGAIKCGTYIGLIDEQQKQIKVNPQVQQNHFIGICLACPNECLGYCRTAGPGINFGTSDLDQYMDEYIMNNQSQYNSKNRNKKPLQSIILNIFVNFTKKIFSISDISNQNFIKFDLDDKNYFYNRSMRLFVQTQEQIKFEVLEYNAV